MLKMLQPFLELNRIFFRGEGEREVIKLLELSQVVDSQVGVRNFRGNLFLPIAKFVVFAGI